jgi:hypothetical protein
MPTPGAETSTAALALEKNGAVRSEPTAATVITCGSEAGNSSGLPAASSLPAAATSVMPFAVAICSCTYSAKQGAGAP